MAFKTYEEARNFLFGFTNYERVVDFDYNASKLDLRRMRALLEFLGEPHLAMHAVHITGTKGKGSTALMIAEILRAAGVRTGAYMSPHLVRLEERICVNGEMIPEDELVRQVNLLLPHLEACARSGRRFATPTFFEIFTAIAWRYFKECGVEVAVVEVGLGGRLDSTNIIAPDVCIITNISLDHTRQLGGTPPRIAAEKAGIVKPGVPVLTAVTDDESLRVIADRCRGAGAPLYLLGRDILLEGDGEFSVGLGRRTVGGLSLKVPGRHQRWNAALAVAAAFVLSESFPAIGDGAIRAGLRRVELPGRIEVTQRKPTVIIDGAHNAASIECLLDSLHDDFACDSLRLVFAVVTGKDIAGMARRIAERARELKLESLTLTGTDSPRSCGRETLLPVFEQALGAAGVDVRVEWSDDVRHLYDCATKAPPGALTCFTGSMYLAGRVKEIVLSTMPGAET
ncbi:MAG: bifunctional folylpolyglutamate synthase/dihydrofolate synthase [Planctomycetota bacterium]|nr:MAG: bifunctional folylpolyglutamate synthase/dihydrofolate synthase [Planctomycetota bacterium]